MELLILYCGFLSASLTFVVLGIALKELSKQLAGRQFIGRSATIFGRQCAGIDVRRQRLPVLAVEEDLRRGRKLKISLHKYL